MILRSQQSFSSGFVDRLIDEMKYNVFLHDQTLHATIRSIEIFMASNEVRISEEIKVHNAHGGLLDFEFRAKECPIPRRTSESPSASNGSRRYCHGELVLVNSHDTGILAITRALERHHFFGNSIGVRISRTGHNIGVPFDV